MPVGEGLRDPQGRVLNYLRLAITERCDLRCAYCRVDGAAHDGADALSPDDLAALGSAFAGRLGFRKVRLTGGEPLLRGDLPEIVRTMRSAGFARVALTTNGRLLARSAAALVAGGLDQVNVSLDTLCAGAYREIRGADVLDEVLSGIGAALAAGVPAVKVNVVLLRSFGFAEFDSFLAWGAGRSLEVRFIELMPIRGVDAEFHRREHVSGAPLVERIEREGFRVVRREADGGPATVYQRPGDPLRVGFVTPITKPFCERCNRLRVTARGALKLCLFGRGSVDLRPGLSGGPAAIAEAVRRAVVLREDGVQSQGRPISCAQGMRGIGG